MIPGGDILGRFACLRFLARSGAVFGRACATGMASTDRRRHTKKGHVMTENEFQSRLATLLGQIESLPEDQRPKLAKLAAETQSRHQRMKKTISELQESLDHLRLSVKYLVFDLEATRRENKYLRNMLESENPGSEGAD
jgi:chromosome segregation ATPase